MQQSHRNRAAQAAADAVHEITGLDCHRQALVLEVAGLIAIATATATAWLAGSLWDQPPTTNLAAAGCLTISLFNRWEVRSTPQALTMLAIGVPVSCALLAVTALGPPAWAVGTLAGERPPLPGPLLVVLAWSCLEGAARRARAHRKHAANLASGRLSQPPPPRSPAVEAAEAIGATLAVAACLTRPATDGGIALATALCLMTLANAIGGTVPRPPSNRRSRKAVPKALAWQGAA